MLTCSECGKQKSPLIRGVCEECGPGIHELWKRAFALMAAAETDFTAETGRRSLEDWYRFEKFLVGWPRAGELAAVLVERGVPC